MRSALTKIILALGLSAASVIACSAEGAAPSGEDVQDNAEDVTATHPGCKAIAHTPYALGGTIITPSGPKAGYVVVANEKIAAIVDTKDQIDASITNVVETNGIISPGLIDLHNHVAYNYIPLWRSGKRFNDRYQWARIAGYDAAVKDPYNDVKNAKHQCSAVKYGELRALVGGTTTIQGSIDADCTRSWVRNVEFENFCGDFVRQDVLSVTALNAEDAKDLNAQFASGKTKAFLVHLAEGIDDVANDEFETLRRLDLLKPQVVGIHSTGLSEDQVEEMGRIGMKIVWSPLSNMILYGKTTKIPTALAAGVKVALAPDWTPSGSANLLGELKMADRVNKTQFNGVITDQQLFEMATKNPSEIVALDDKIGSIEVGKYADLMVIQGDAKNVYRAVIDAQPSDVLMTTIGGQVFYGEPGLVAQTGSTRNFETIDACGAKRMISTTEVKSTMPESTKTLGTMVSEMQADGAKDIIPLLDCTTTQFEFAFDPLPAPPAQK